MVYDFLLSIQYTKHPPFEKVFNKGKDKNIAGLPQSISRPQPALVHWIIFPSNKD